MKRSFREGYPNHVYCKCVDGNTPNHTHAQQSAEKRRDFVSFNQALVSQFTRGYNIQHNRSGELFHKPFGSVPKIGEKYIKNNLSYINNNGASGKLSKGVLDYRWNLMAYYGTFENALFAMDANTGSEHDIKEDWEDFSEYRSMIEVCRQAGYNMESINFKLMKKEELFDLVILLSSVTKDKRKIFRFLHMESGHEIID